MYSPYILTLTTHVLYECISTSKQICAKASDLAHGCPQGTRPFKSREHPRNTTDAHKGQYTLNKKTLAMGVRVSPRQYLLICILLLIEACRSIVLYCSYTSVF